MPLQEREYNTTSGISTIVCWASVDQDPAARRSSQEGSISLPDVKKM
ncbi:MAG TPA: hypothetical protein VFD73_06660 [Gemmatimonadales bacterium]|nr:hypothetical protein [Gemmatimonadales bacterium]